MENSGFYDLERFKTGRTPFFSLLLAVKEDNSKWFEQMRADFTLKNLGASHLFIHSVHTLFDFNGNRWNVLLFPAPGQPATAHLLIGSLGRAAASTARQTKSKKKIILFRLYVYIDDIPGRWSQLSLWSKLNLNLRLIIC